jgi:hypothetical protein
LFPDNAQVVDHHAYSEGVVQAFWEKSGIGLFSPEPAPDLVHNEFLKSMLKPNPISWEDFLKRTGRVREEWWSIAWLYENLDNKKFDEWCLANFPAYEQKIKESLEKQFECAAKFAQARKLPLVVDEGFILYPPLHSQFLTTPEGRRGEEYGVNAAIATGHWGIMLSGYFRPDTPAWKNDSQCDWARGVNKRILASG